LHSKKGEPCDQKDDEPADSKEPKRIQGHTVVGGPPHLPCYKGKALHQKAYERVRIRGRGESQKSPGAARKQWEGLDDSNSSARPSKRCGKESEVFGNRTEARLGETRVDIERVGKDRGWGVPATKRAKRGGPQESNPKSRKPSGRG